MNKPTVSQLLDILNKPALLKWANKIGLEGTSLDTYRSKSMAAGSSLHEQIKNHILYGMPFDEVATQDKFNIFIGDKKIISVEQDIETEWFIGRYDVEVSFNDTFFLCDWKSSDAIYFENILQLVAYRMARPDHKVAIVQIPSFKFKPLGISDFLVYEEILKSLYTIFVNKKRIGQ